MAEWRQFANKQKEKRGKGKNARKEKNDAGSEITVQRMSSDVSGKQQKYSRIGPREYVLFDCEDLTIDNIKAACQKHFAKRVERDMVCDVLAGERGPSCSKMSQIPDLKVFYVRFIKNHFATVDDDEDIDDAKYQVVSLEYIKLSYLYLQHLCRCFCNKNMFKPAEVVSE